LYFAAGVGGAILSSVHNTGISVGASGAVFGLIGAIIVLSGVKKKEVGGLSYFTILLYGMLSIGMGMMTAGVDNYAHLGGLIIGIMLQYVFFISEGIKK